MLWDDVIIFDGLLFLFWMRLVVVKLLEWVKGEELLIYVVLKLLELVVSRKLRFKFLDLKKDCFVNFKVSNYNGELCLLVCYEN